MIYKQLYRFKNSLKSCDNVYTILYKVDSYLPLQWKLRPLVAFLTEPDILWNKKITRIAIGEIVFSVNTLHIQIMYS